MRAVVLQSIKSREQRRLVLDMMDDVVESKFSPGELHRRARMVAARRAPART